MWLDNAWPERVVLWCRGEAPGEPGRAAVMQHAGGVPYLGHVLGGLKRNRFTDIVVVTREDGEAIERRYGDGRPMGLRLRYLHDPEGALGTAGALAALGRDLGRSALLVDAARYPVLDYETAAMAFVEAGLPVLMAVMAAAPGDPANCRLARDGRDRSIVARYRAADSLAGATHLDYGVLVVRGDLAGRVPPEGADLGVVLQGDAVRGRIAAYEVRHRTYDVTTREGIRSFRSSLVSGAVPSYIHLLDQP